ncbi:hypothetical protein LOK49_LG06G03129 [Camellia lanceoleosa]|uniref:Uncharacterized protein n=1 Tax=Camellia lanceoleosa TaxID=1840588 RepID=A0ACC0HFF6_9ERIC|nr:hypothetical protein LOK49_LG06G03129 [Camellia lanceoleosa]
MKQSNVEMYHCEANVLAIMPLSTSFPSDVNEKTELQRVDTHVTLINDIGQMACDVDLIAEYGISTGFGRQMKPSDSGVVNEGECDSKQEMEDEIIEVDNIADPDRTFSLFDLTNRLPIWKLLSTQEKEKLKEAYEKGGDKNDYGIIVCFIIKQLVCHLDVDKLMGGESCRTMRAGMVKSFVNDRRRSFVAGN